MQRPSVSPVHSSHKPNLIQVKKSLIVLFLRQRRKLVRTFSTVHKLIMIGIGSIIGAGIFVVAGTAAAEHAGPAVLISFVIAALGCLFTGLSARKPTAKARSRAFGRSSSH